jgi:hypothetical protein
VDSIDSAVSAHGGEHQVLLLLLLLLLLRGLPCLAAVAPLFSISIARFDGAAL